MHRVAGLGIAIVAFIHLVGQHIWLKESPVWFNTIFALWSKVLDRAVEPWVIGIVLTVIVLALAWLVAVKRSRLAAFLFLIIAVWDAVGRFRQVMNTLSDDNLTLGTPMLFGAAATAMALLLGLYAFTATMRRS